MRSFLPFTATTEEVDPPPRPPAELADAAAAGPVLWKGAALPESLRPLTATVDVVEPPPRPPLADEAAAPPPCCCSAALWAAASGTSARTMRAETRMLACERWGGGERAERRKKKVRARLRRTTKD